MIVYLEFPQTKNGMQYYPRFICVSLIIQQGPMDPGNQVGNLGEWIFTLTRITIIWGFSQPPEV